MRLLQGLLACNNFKEGSKRGARDHNENEDFFQAVFEVGRRYKVCVSSALAPFKPLPFLWYRRGQVLAATCSPLVTMPPLLALSCHAVLARLQLPCRPCACSCHAVLARV